VIVRYLSGIGGGGGIGGGDGYHGTKLCLGETCVTEDDLKRLLRMDDEVVRYRDDVVIAADGNHGKNGGNTSNCGWYGCRVANMGSDRKMTFRHGGSNPRKFWLRKHPSNR
jgi:metallophosphoesterase superfamily enzyme